jgi:hypothetical protein
MGDNQRQNEGSLKQIREQVIERLTDGYAHNLLEEEEFEQMIAEATNAGSKQELITLSENLPTIPGQRSADIGMPVTINRGPVKQEDILACVFSGTTRKGVWRPARKINSFTLFGGTEIDFSDAEIPSDGVVIDLFCVFGGVDIRIPEGLNVDSRGFALFGGFDDKSDGVVREDVPTVTIRGLVLFGGVDIKMRRKKRKRRNEK